MRLINDHILRTVQGSTVLVTLSNEETDFHGMVALNHSAAVLCRLLRQDIDRDSLITELAKEYDTAPEQVATDVDTFLSQLDACHLLIW